MAPPAKKTTPDSPQATLAPANEAAANAHEAVDGEETPSPSTTSTPTPPSTPPTPHTPVVTHRVQRPVSLAGLDRLPGELIDASEWRTAKSLEVMRYITPVESCDPIPTSDGRLWDDLEVAMAHEDTLSPVAS